MITVALPTWNNRPIIWLALEGLCRQETTADWELIIYECSSHDMLGESYFDAYIDRLKKAGCKRIVYANSGDRLPLGQKWKDMAHMADSNSRYLLLHGSDDLSHPKRIQVTSESNADWYHTRHAYQYSFEYKSLIFYDIDSLGAWKTGFDMAIKTELVRGIPNNDMRRGVDFFLYGHCANTIDTDQAIYPGVATTGLNTISANRNRFFQKVEPPFLPTDKTIDDIGLPIDIVGKLKQTKAITPLQLHQGKKVDVIFIKRYQQLFKKGQRTRVYEGAYQKLSRDGYVQIEGDKPREPYTMQL